MSTIAETQAKETCQQCGQSVPADRGKRIEWGSLDNIGRALTGLDGAEVKKKFICFSCQRAGRRNGLIALGVVLVAIAAVAGYVMFFFK